MNSQKITNLAVPVAGTDAVTKDYADSLGGGSHTHEYADITDFNAGV